MRASRWACSFFAESYSAFSAMSPNSRASRIRSAISRRLSFERYSISAWSFLYPSGVRMTSFKAAVLLETPARKWPAAGRRPAGADGTSGPGGTSTVPGYDARDAGKSPGIVVDRRRRDPDAGRPRTHGGRQRPGVPPPGPPLRRRARLLGDGLLRRDRAPEREDARLPARRLRRASARDPDLRRRPARDGRGGPDGRGGRRRHRRHELRLPRPQGHEDGRRCAPAPGRAARLPHHRGGRERRRRAGEREDAARRRGRLAQRARARAEARRGRRGDADAAPALGEADVHGLRGPHADGRARRARRRAGDRIGRRDVAREGGSGARRDRAQRR